MTQPAVINQIIEALNIHNDCKLHDTPTNITLSRDKNGKRRKNDWNHRSIIGMVSFLANTTRPDISFAVHQCANHGIDPKQSHETAVKRIGRYIIRTKDEGIIMWSNGTKNLKWSPMQILLDRSQ